MKALRFLILLLICTMIFSSLIGAFAERTYLCGDADCDSKITVSDATAVQRHLADLANIAFDEKAADIDSDGLSVTDATNIQRWLAEFEVPYPIGEPFVDDDPPTETEPPTEKPTKSGYTLPFVPD